MRSVWSIFWNTAKLNRYTEDSHIDILSRGASHRKNYNLDISPHTRINILTGINSILFHFIVRCNWLHPIPASPYLRCICVEKPGRFRLFLFATSIQPKSITKRFFSCPRRNQRLENRLRLSEARNYANLAVQWTTVRTISVPCRGRYIKERIRKTIENAVGCQTFLRTCFISSRQALNYPLTFLTPYSMSNWLLCLGTCRIVFSDES